MSEICWLAITLSGDSGEDEEEEEEESEERENDPDHGYCSI